MTSITSSSPRWGTTAALVLGLAIAGCGTPARELEPRAIAELRMITSAQLVYASTCGQFGYASSLDVLTTNGLLDLTGIRHLESSYAITLGPGRDASKGPVDCHGVATIRSFYVSAKPRVSGARAFATDEKGDIWVSATADPPSLPFGPPAKPLQ